MFKPIKFDSGQTVSCMKCQLTENMFLTSIPLSFIHLHAEDSFGIGYHNMNTFLTPDCKVCLYLTLCINRKGHRFYD